MDFLGNGALIHQASPAWSRTVNIVRTFQLLARIVLAGGDTMRLSTVGFLGFSSVFLAGCGYPLFGATHQFQEEFHYSYGIGPGGKVEVENQNGRVDIAGWDQSTVDIRGTKYADRPDQ